MVTDRGETLRGAMALPSVRVAIGGTIVNLVISWLFDLPPHIAGTSFMAIGILSLAVFMFED